jgi:membrane peptidoglycan carboxypeptidase
VQADSSETPFDVNEGAKLDLGSTAKLRTLITYLELVSELHARYVSLEPATLAALQVHPRDRLGRWAVDYLMHARDRSLPSMLEAAMERRYSASPAEGFFTGGGLHTFANFRPEDDARIVTVREAFRHSINLPFVRMMREIVQHIMFAAPRAQQVLDDPNLRTDYLRRFADREGQVFVRRFHARYGNMPPDELLAALADRLPHASPAALSMVFRSVVPHADADALRDFLAPRLPADRALDAQRLQETYEPSRYSLSDRGHIAGLHPLELWTVAFLYRRPHATLDEAIAASFPARQAAYDWLLRTRHSSAQDRRIVSLLEREVFAEIHRRWQRLGYPFDRLVPSYATAIGSSADRPAALAELMGIIVGDGMRQPTVRIRALHFAAGTPFETRMVQSAGAPERVLAPEIAALLRRALVDVVEHGTARRLGSAIALRSGVQLAFGGKTGTGDNRFETYGPSGRLLDSRVVSRAATFAFIIGDRYFGTVTAYVHGSRARHYRFTSALPVQVLKALTPALSAHLGVPCSDEPVTRILTKAGPSAKAS